MYKEYVTIDDDLLVGLSGGDPAAFRALIKIYFPILSRFAVKFLQDAFLAEDVVQETFVKFWRANPVFTRVSSLKAYLFVTTRNGCLNLQREQRREESRRQASLEDGVADPFAAEAVYSESLVSILEIVSELSAGARDVFYLSFEEGLSVSEIASRLGMKLKTVKTHKYRTLQVLRKRLGGDPGALMAITALLF